MCILLVLVAHVWYAYCIQFIVAIIVDTPRFTTKSDAPAPLCTASTIIWAVKPLPMFGHFLGGIVVNNQPQLLIVNSRGDAPLTDTGELCQKKSKLPTMRDNRWLPFLALGQRVHGLGGRSREGLGSHQHIGWQSASGITNQHPWLTSIYHGLIWLNDG